MGRGPPDRSSWGRSGACVRVGRDLLLGRLFLWGTPREVFVSQSPKNTLRLAPLGLRRFLRGAY